MLNDNIANHYNEEFQRMHFEILYNENDDDLDEIFVFNIYLFENA